MELATRQTSCRICSGTRLDTVLDLGNSALTGIFPAPGESVAEGPLELVRCADCTLVQLAHSFPADMMYGDNYGYRSGLNAGMVEHLQSKAQALEAMAGLASGDVVLDIGCNDGTLLAGYRTEGIHRLGIDPTAEKFSRFHPDDMTYLADFFSRENYSRISDQPAKVITSIAMFYDLDDPVAFARDVAGCLDPQGVWHLEQSYMPSMLRTGSYDTVCHEHIEYYSLRNIVDVLDRADLKPVSVRFNNTNGGSFSVTAMM